MSAINHFVSFPLLFLVTKASYANVVPVSVSDTLKTI